VQALPTHVWLTHGTGVPHCPAVLHVCTPLPEHCAESGVQLPLHTPPTQVPLLHAAGVPHCPQPPHVSSSVEEHCALPGVHTGLDAHEHAPQVHPAAHDCVPYVLHGCVAPGAHTPWLAHVPLVCQAPVVLHVCVSVPQLPQGTGVVCPGAHFPVHAPFTQVWPTHATGVPHWSFDPHVCTPFPEHCSCPVTHVPAHTPPAQLPLAHATGAPHCPPTQICTADPEHRVCPDEHTLASPPPADSEVASPPLPPPSLPLPLPPPLLLALDSVVTSIVPGAPSADPVSSRSSMPASAAHPAPVAAARHVAMPMRTPIRMLLDYHAPRSPVERAPLPWTRRFGVTPDRASRRAAWASPGLPGRCGGGDFPARFFSARSRGITRRAPGRDARLDLQVGLDVAGELVGCGAPDLPQARAHPLAQPLDDGFAQQLLGRRPREGGRAGLEDLRDLQIEEAGVGRPVPIQVMMVVVPPAISVVVVVVVVVVVPVAVAAVVARAAASIVFTHRAASSLRERTSLGSKFET
jgi:hypothetical protein